jgi:transcriptional regulator GlxA family with amidase domain
LRSFRAFDIAPNFVVGSAVLSASLGGKLPLFSHLHQPISVECKAADLLPLFAHMLTELSSPRVGTRAAVSAEMKQIVMASLRSSPSSGFSLVMPTINSTLANALQTVLSRPQDDHRVEKLIASAGLSRERFKYHFSKAWRCTPQEFVLAVRLSKAAKLLGESNLRFPEIAASLGMSPSYLGKAFRASYGLTPRQFRRVAPSN